jgi:hypothetical protein
MSPSRVMGAGVLLCEALLRIRETSNATMTPVEPTAIAIGDTNSHGEGRMSLETASHIFDLSSIALAVGACVVFVATALIVWTGIVKEHHWDVLREQARSQIATLESATARAGAEIAKANAETAKANERTAAVELALEKERIARLQLEEKQAALLKHQAQRKLTDDQRRTLIGALTHHAGQRVSIASILGDSDGKEFGEEFASVFREAGWDHGGDAGITYSVWDKEPVGVEVTLNEADARAGRVAPGIEALILTLRQLGLTHPTTVFMNAAVPAGQVQVRIGRKTPPRASVFVS